jgi:hypothetical protein
MALENVKVMAKVTGVAALTVVANVSKVMLLVMMVR